MIHTQNAVLKGIEKENLRNKKLIERTCLMGTSCAKIHNQRMSPITESDNSYSYTFLNDIANFTVHVNTHHGIIHISMHSFKNHDGMNKIIDHIIKILEPDLDISTFNIESE